MQTDCIQYLFLQWGRAKGAAKASCGENGRPKGCFWRVRFLSAPLRFSCVSRANLKGGREETDSPKAPFWTTVSPHDAFAAPLAHSDTTNLKHGWFTQKAREPRLNPPVRMNFLPFALGLKGKARKVHTSTGVQMWFASFLREPAMFQGEILKYWLAQSPVKLNLYPKDPAVLKILRRSKFTLRSKFTIA